MRSKTSNNDQDSIKGLMTMTVLSVISDALKVDIELIEPQNYLVKDLGMTAKSQVILERLIKEMFDDLIIDLTIDSEVQQIIDQVLQDEFDELEYEEMNYNELV